MFMRCRHRGRFPAAAIFGILFLSGCRSVPERLQCAPETRRAVFDGTVVWLPEAPTVDVFGRLRLSELDREKLLTPLLAERPAIRRPVRKILIDPGHGGAEPGAVGGKFQEKHLNLALARKIRDELNRRGFEAVMTRDADTTLSLEERGRMPGRIGADLFLSVHHNAGKPDAAGVETFAMTPAGAESTHGGHEERAFPGNAFDAANVRLAYEIQRRLSAAVGGPDRGMKFARFRVLTLAECPGALIEAGFVSHPVEEAAIASEERQLRAARAGADAVEAFAR